MRRERRYTTTCLHRALLCAAFLVLYSSLSIAQTLTIGGSVYGGARKAGVNTAQKDSETKAADATHVIINGGEVHDVYGGNDITGNVYGGTTVEIRSTVQGDVYGGGNGSYAYTDNKDMKTAAAASADPAKKIIADIYYDPAKILGREAGTTFTELESAQALNKFRPNVEKTLVRLTGNSSQQTYIEGKVFCGGNSATLASFDGTSTPAASLEIGSYVTVDRVFLGSNGENMVNTDEGSALRLFKDDEYTVGDAQFDYSKMNLSNASTFAEYMKGVEVGIRPKLTLIGLTGGEAGTSHIGSFFLGGNRGSMTAPGTFNVSFNREIIIYNKIVGGCNDANIEATAYNAAYEGGLTNATELTNGNKVYLQIRGFKFEPSILTNTEGLYSLSMNTEVVVDPDHPDDVSKHKSRKMIGGNVYGGCYNSGHINGNVRIDITDETITAHAKNDFLTVNDNQAYYNMTQDPTCTSLACFGGGYGTGTEIRGNTEINVEPTGEGALYKQVAVKVFGGGEMGAVTGNTTVNIRNGMVGRAYGGSYQGSIGVTTAGVTTGGVTTLNLDGGLILNAFGGSCDADIEGYSQVHIGRNGRPWVRESVYGGNDFGGTIKGSHDFKDNVTSDASRSSVYKYGGSTSPVLTTSTYVEYQQGMVETPGAADNPLSGGNIFGGNFGHYAYGASGVPTPTNGKPFLAHGSFVNFRPANDKEDNDVARVYGGSMGAPDDADKNKMQERSYVLVDFPNTYNHYSNLEVFGSGNYAGLGMKSTPVEANAAPDNVSAVIDLVNGNIANAYGGSYQQGITRRSVVNVPAASTIKIRSIFGGAYGTEILPPCDVYESNVNYKNTSENAIVTGAIYGGNNNQRRTIYAHVNISSPVWSNKASGYMATIYGAGKGINTWAEYTEVNLNDGANVYEVYGGAEDGHVLNAESVQKYMQLYTEKPTEQISQGDDKWKQAKWWTGGVVGSTLKDEEARTEWAKDWRNAWDLEGYYTPNAEYNDYVDNATTNLTNSSQVTTAGMDDRNYTGYTDAAKARNYQKYNTNVLIHRGANVVGYAYGGGYGKTRPLGGDVYGTSFIALLGGKVTKDIYAGGTSGGVYDLFGVGAYNASTNATGFTATSNAYIKGGTCRNVYGAGWKGDVGYEDPLDHTNDVLGATYVHIGDTNGTSFTDGIPTVQRNAYGGGEGETKDGVTEGSSVIGTAHVSLYNGYIGYVYNSETDEYEEKLDDETQPEEKQKGALEKAGNIFGGGYVDDSNTYYTDITMYGGTVRNSLYGGGEIGTIGLGESDGSWTKAGSTKVTMYGGHVLQDVFGGGRGFSNVDWIFGTKGTSGYVFGTTEVNIHRGTIGTEHTVADGHGNVFGGGNIGYVYSTAGVKNRGGKTDGYYYDTSDKLTEDCKVIISPYVQVTHPTTIGGHEYAVGDYVETSVLNTLAANDLNWKTTSQEGNFDNLGVNIGNAVFAGGNVTAGSDQVYANTETVFGNATASVMDVFIKDLITIGSDGVGGLYGDGNLTLVDGYRELNITNYGTDYYNLNSSLSYEDYQKLNDRERAYFELQYQTSTAHMYEYYRCTNLHNYGDITYHVNQKITPAEWATLPTTEQANWVNENYNYSSGDKIKEEEYNLMDEAERAKWTLFGFCTLYAGRIMNTIQRADFCGVFGSRVVLRGAQDRVPSVVDYTNYTINRIDELSLNQQRDREEGAPGCITHGNYFGIYSVVNYLGALTSDVRFYDPRTTENDGAAYTADGTTTYYQWKEENKGNRKRNDGSSFNEVALSSGVWLEILDKETETAGHKVYGPITGVVELALLNVAPGEGGGYVYAKNMHGAYVSDTSPKQVTLAASNDDALSYKQYIYDESDLQSIQTSGNFISSTKRIIDDCYPQSNSYSGVNASPAHYWYIRGDFYIYDQYISAYTGSAQAYAQKVSIPLTITAEAQGKLKLNSINENLYAYWTDDYEDLSNYRSQTDPTAVIVNNITYHKNDPISHWEYSRLNEQEKAFFMGKTYVSMENMTLSSGTYTRGQVLTPAQYIAVPDNEWVCTTSYTTSSEVKHEHGEVLNQAQYDALPDIDKQHYESAKSLVRVSNAISHDNGFLLSFTWDNPDIWNDYYHKLNNSLDIDRTVRASVYDSDDFAPSRANYTPSPTFKCNTSGVFGQVDYTKGDLINEIVYNYESSVSPFISEYHLGKQAEFVRAYVAKENCEFTDGGNSYSLVAGAPIPYTTWNTFSITNKAHFDEGYIYMETYKISDTEYALSGELITATAYSALSPDQKKALSPVYICTDDGAWGGKVYLEGTNYPAIDFSNLSYDERAHFSYNYDALDLLSENFVSDGVSGLKYQGQEHDIAAGNQIPYCTLQPIDYTATYTGATMTGTDRLTNSVTVKRGGVSTTTNQLHNGDELINTEYESLINEKFHYTPIVVSGNDAEGTIYYVVNQGIQVGDNWYNVGNKISGEIYSLLTSDNKSKVTLVPRSSLPDRPTGAATKNYYFCTSAYTAQTAVTDITGDHTAYAVGATVPAGAIIGADESTIGVNTVNGYAQLKNEQSGFTIDGRIPTETTTLYVSRETDINDLSQDKIITVEYLYDYIESDGSGSSYETIRERHVVNVHIHFESGVPIIGELLPPRMVLPGNVLGLNQPSVTKGAYEILGGGWEVFSSLSDATSHKNGTPYTNNLTPTYWYQDGYYVAYYAKTYLGKTYSNAVQFTVANYHDIADVMAATGNHLYIDHPSLGLPGKRPAKIYIDNEANDVGKSELDMFADLFTLSTNPQTANAETGVIPTVTVDGVDHTGLNPLVTNCDHLNFILSSNVAPEKYSPEAATPSTWTPIGDATHCFRGWFHGNGYTVSGLDNSLFGKVCGNIYNVGVMGSFSEGGIAQSADDDSHIENTWVSTTAVPEAPATKIGKPIVADVSTSTPFVYNSYYPSEQPWTAHTSDDKLDIHGRLLADFVNGQVAYDLNSNYLQARYMLHGHHSNAANAVDKKVKKAYYLKPNGEFVTETGTDGDGNPIETNVEYTIEYTSNATEWPWHSGNGFVEDYMGDGDFRFCDAIVPTRADVSYNGTETFIPVFPDDYIYFGQVLSYDLYNTATERPAHGLYPTGIVKYHTTKSGDVVDNSKHLLLNLEPRYSNRVYRAPAYFRNGTFGRSVTFNSSAAFAASYSTYNPHKNLTAIDFTGNSDITGYSGVVPGDIGDFKDRNHGYAPLLDYFGLDGIRMSGITQNLLAYTPASTGVATDAATKTNTVLTSYFREPAYDDYYDNNKGYRIVNRVPDLTIASVKGHLVQLNGNYKAMTDHLLVDRQDYNAPIAYQFTTGKRMWYQRKPDNFADKNKGWEAVSLPFTAELVSTHQKGEITHFYEGSTKGHEYWLREFTGIDSEHSTSDVVAAIFNYPEPATPLSGVETKTDGNTFLWDYYYNRDSRNDENSDKYQQYYSEERSYENYPYGEAAKPYLVGFPGARYYEFDLSGTFDPQHTSVAAASEIDKLEEQAISFASVAEARIAVSDTELENNKVTEGSYTFMPSYLNETIDVGDGFLLNSDAAEDQGSSFDKVSGEAKTVAAFRPYFKLSAGARTISHNVRSIVFSASPENFGVEEPEEEQADINGRLIVIPGKDKITVKSSLRKAVNIRITNAHGITMASFRLEPGGSRTTNLYSGVYIVRGKKYVVK